MFRFGGIALAACAAFPALADTAPCAEWRYLEARLGCEGCANTPPLAAILDAARQAMKDHSCRAALPKSTALLDAATFPALRLPTPMLTCGGYLGPAITLFASPHTDAPTLAQTASGDRIEIKHDWIGAGASWDFVTLTRGGSALALGWAQLPDMSALCVDYSDAYLGDDSS